MAKVEVRKLTPESVQDRLMMLPDDSGVYVFQKGTKAQYIGKARSLRQRIRQHTPWIRSMVDAGTMDALKLFICANEGQAMTLEEQMIREMQPKYNTAGIEMETMVRTQIYLRPDQIRWLERKAKRAGKGVTRSDWVRCAIDELMRRDVDA